MLPLTDLPPITPHTAGGEVPLADQASLVLRAGRMGTVLPHMGWVLRFPTRISVEELTAEAERLAASPYALGRRVQPRRVPGGRRRWVATPVPPPVRLAPRPVDSDALAGWLDGELPTPLDPEHGHGWLVTAAHTTDGGTVVLVIVHHLYGIAPGVLEAAYGDGSVDPRDGTVGLTFQAHERYELRQELRSVVERLVLGVRGAGRMTGDALRAAASRDSAAKAPVTDPPPIPDPRGRDRTRRSPGPARSGVIAEFSAEEWDTRAAELGGTGNTLLAAIAANMVRRGRVGRGGDVDRPVRLVLPIDLGADAVGERRDGALGVRPNMVTASLVLPGGPPQYGDLTVTRRWMKAAFVADAATAPPVRGFNDAARLLPEALAIRFAERAALSFDACASNPGAMPAGVRRLGRHTATSAATMGWPIALDLIAALSRGPDSVGITVVGDPSRLGPGADVRGWLGDELRGWGLRDGRW